MNARPNPCDFDIEVRPAPRTEGWYRSQAEQEVGNLYRDKPAVRENRVREIMAMLRQIDGALCKNIRRAG